jgi:cob(I)alamin adenosyltransferase
MKDIMENFITTKDGIKITILNQEKDEYEGFNKKTVLIELIERLKETSGFVDYVRYGLSKREYFHQIDKFDKVLYDLEYHLDLIIDIIKRDKEWINYEESKNINNAIENLNDELKKNK